MLYRKGERISPIPIRKKRWVNSEGRGRLNLKCVFLQ